MGLRLWPLLVMVLATAVAAQTFGYRGQESREIKALSAEETADLLAGRGMGAARAAELNHFPGPAHVLELREQIELSTEQIGAVWETFDRMTAAAKRLGFEIVAGDMLRAETAIIAELQGKLRAVHLAAHLETRGLLSPEQLERYDALRGYAGGVAPPAHDHRRHNG